MKITSTGDISYFTASHRQVRNINFTVIVLKSELVVRMDKIETHLRVLQYFQLVKSVKGSQLFIVHSSVKESVYIFANALGPRCKTIASDFRSDSLPNFVFA